MSKRATVLGCGLVGMTMARDLAKDGDLEVVVADLSDERLAKVAQLCGAKTERADLSDPAVITKLAGDTDVLLGALPSRFAYESLRAVAQTGTPYSDISFMPEDALDHNDLAAKRGTRAVVDCGVAPGLSNLFVGRELANLDRIHRADIIVGGLPKLRVFPFEYKAPFAPSDVVEEYTRPARMKEDGRIVIKDPLTEPELVDLPHAGTLESFNTDGLRSLLRLDIPTMTEKTLRYPGHATLMRAFHKTGLFSEDPIEVGGAKIAPRDLTTQLLLDRWKLGDTEPEFTVMRVTAVGEKDGKTIRRTYDLYDEHDAETNTSSMSRTTAFPATIVARMLLDGTITREGVCAPETIAQDEKVFNRILKELAERNVAIETNEQPIEQCT